MNFWKIIANSKGALFGIDARIAMAIFGSITIVIGYFSYGKINMAKDSALLKELEGLNNAIQNYQTDMGTFYSFTIATSDGSNDFMALYDSTVISAGHQINWNGPYFSFTSTNHLTYGSFTITYAQEDHTLACNASSNCYVWLGLSQVSETIWEQINSFVDEDWGSSPEANGTAIGNLQADAITDPRTLFYRSVARKR